jgi:hypothetical protein
MRFQAGRWVEDDGTPVDPETMLTASQGPGPVTQDGSPESTKDPRKVTVKKRDPRKNRGVQ